MDPRQNSIEIFLAGVESVKPVNLINRYVSVNKDTLQIENLEFSLSAFSNIFVVGAGKASAMMAKAMEDILGARITAGHIIAIYILFILRINYCICIKPI